MNVQFTLNGKSATLSVDPMERLSDALRDRCGIQSMMNDCGIGLCGKCAVFLDGQLVPSCLVPMFKVRGRTVVTWEGFRGTAAHAAAAKAFGELGVELCGFCDAATMMAAGSLVAAPHEPTESEIVETMSSVYCRCASPTTVLAAARRALEAKSGKGRSRAAH